MADATPTSGHLASADITAGTNTTLYTAPAQIKSGSIEVTVNVCNRSSQQTAKIRIMRQGSDATVSDTDYLAYDVSVKPNGTYEKTGIQMAANNVIKVYSDRAQVTFQAGA